MPMNSRPKKTPKMPKLKPIPQEHAMGCGLACVAFLVGISYQRVVSLDDEPRRAWTRGYYCPELVELLSRLGRKYKWRAVTRRLRSIQIPNGSIVFVERSEEWPEGHYFVKVAENKYMNPWVNSPSIKSVRAGFQKKVGVITHVITPQ